jgi:glycosyltransferase involved in cell wall biosynthesis
MGAQRNYAVPAAFEQFGMLQALYTDLCGTRGFGRVAASLARFPVPMRTKLAALAARLPPPSVARKTTTFDWIGLQIEADRQITDGRYHRALARALGSSMVRAGFDEATHVYSIMGEGDIFLVEAKKRGIRIVSEVCIALSTAGIVRAEAKAFPGWGKLPSYASLPRSKRPPDEIMLTTSDVLTCPSDFVRDDLVGKYGVSPDRAVVVPYPVDARWLGLDNRPEPGRILFAGTAELRKGIHYLAMAAERLAARHRCRFRVAGHAAPEVTSQPICRSLEFLGRLPRTEIHREFGVADLFVLPSLAEGSALVTYEALGAGLPVVATKAAGSVVRDGIDGLIVPERDPDALAGAIERIVADRALRARMAAAARERAREFTMDKFAERLVDSLIQKS